MKSIAAIDLIDGQVVRLINGKLENKIIYSNDPIEIAKRWEADGVDSLHLVDLNFSSQYRKKQYRINIKNC